MKSLSLLSAFVASSTFALIAPPTLERAYADDFVQTVTCTPSGTNRCDPGEDPRPVRWYQQVVEYSVHERGSQDLHPGEQEITDDLRDAVITSFDQWNEPECSDFEMIYGGKNERSATGYDQNLSAEENINVLAWRDDSWPHAGHNAVALTTVTYRPSSGEILSSDIEFNTADYRFTNTDGSEGAQIDFRNTLTHEAGHFLGLDHSSHPDSTMFATAPLEEIKKRTLDEADIDGLCHIYPTGNSYDIADYVPGYTPPDDPGSESDSGWCSTTQTNPALPSLIVVFIGLFVLRRRR